MPIHLSTAGETMSVIGLLNDPAPLADALYINAVEREHSLAAMRKPSLRPRRLHLGHRQSLWSASTNLKSGSPFAITFIFIQGASAPAISEQEAPQQRKPPRRYYVSEYKHPGPEPNLSLLYICPAGRCILGLGEALIKAFPLCARQIIASVWIMGEGYGKETA